MSESILLELTDFTAHLVQDRLQERRDSAPSESAFDLVTAYSVLAELLAKQLEWLQNQLKQGCEGQSLRQVVGTLLRATQLAQPVGVRLPSLASREYLEEVEASTATVERIRADLEKLSTWVNAPRPVFDPDQLQTPPAESREGYVSLSDLRARLRSTGRP